MNWLYYLLEANLYLAVFYSFYRLFLYKETFYSLNRFYIITTTCIAFALPFLQIGYLYHLFNEDTTNYITAELVVGDQENDVNKFIISCYLFISAAFLIRLGINLHKIIRLAIKGKKQRKGKIIYIELTNSETAFSFFNLLFINPLVKEQKTVLKHEMVHILQKHSLDIILFELVQIVNWFNPVTWLIKNDIKLLHEYIADDAISNNEMQKHEYAMFLIQNSFGITPEQLTNQIFNPSILKRRINMLNKKRSAGWARLRLLLVVPIAGGMLCASTMAFSKNYEMIDLYPQKPHPAKQIPPPPPPVEPQLPPPPPIEPGQQSPPPPPFEPIQNRSKKLGKSPSTVNNGLITTITRGGTHQIILPDGTRVWMNADSRISFPLRFTGQERKIFLSGEAYLEVAKDKMYPFVVKTDQQEIKILSNSIKDKS